MTPDQLRLTMTPDQLKHRALQLVQDCLRSDGTIAKNHTELTDDFGPRDPDERAWFRACAPNEYMLRLVIRTGCLERLRQRILDSVGDYVPRMEIAVVDGDLHVQIDVGSPGRPFPLPPN